MPAEAVISPSDELVDVSVLSPTYNERRFIGECTQRMREQEFDNSIEFPFIDGRSDYGTASSSRISLFGTPAFGSWRIPHDARPTR
jgi:hypothetical protein